MRSLLNGARLRIMAFVAGGGMLVLSGCDPAARETVLTGVESATTGLFATFIQAFFQTLLNDTEGTATTVKALTTVVEHLA